MSMLSLMKLEVKALELNSQTKYLDPHKESTFICEGGDGSTIYEWLIEKIVDN